ncbi:MAG: galactose oxidase, partial [Pseudomonadota bacterium]
MIKRRTLLSFSAGTLSAGWMRTPVYGGNADANWTTAAPIPINTQEIYPAVHDGKLVVAGGIAAKLGVPYFTRSAFAYDPETDKWNGIPDLPEALHHVALVSTGRELWAIGGFNGGYSHIWRMRDTVYRLAGEGWQSQAALPGPQAEGVATFFGGNIHVVAGQQPRGANNSKRSDHHEVPLHWYWDGSRWASLAPIPTPRNSATGGWI